MSDRVPPAAPRGADAPAAHRFGRFVLTALEGKSRRTMVWRAQDPQRGEPMLLVLPRERPADAAAVQAWLAGVRRAGRITHPHLAGLLEAGSVERWPYALYACGAGATLARLLADRAPSVIEAVRIIAAAAEGLASAHDAGLAHHDLQPQLVLLGDDREPRLFGLQAGAAPGDDTGAAAAAPALTHVDALQLQAQRTAARHDVLALGLLLQQLLAGKPWDDEGDVTALADRLPPIGRELVRLPWNPARPVSEALRAIANRATDRQPRQRYGSARALQRALEGWLQAEGGAGGGPIALVLDRLHAAGTLPAAPGAAQRVARLALMHRQRTVELAELVLQDVGLSLELLRWVNSAQLRDLHAAGHGPILTVRRAIAMIGLDGVRRVALGLRDWPGPLDSGSAQVLARRIEQAQRAAGWARALRPPGYDDEVVGLIALLQNLGRLVCAYHLPDEMRQIERLMQSLPDARGETQPGMDEVSAACAVLGCDLETLGAAVAREWGLDDAALPLLRRLPVDTPPRSAGCDDAVLRAVASCANECGDAMLLDGPARQAALRRVAQRYARVLRLTLRDLEQALGLTPAATRNPGPGAAGDPGEPEEPGRGAQMREG